MTKPLYAAIAALLLSGPTAAQERPHQRRIPHRPDRPVSARCRCVTCSIRCHDQQPQPLIPFSHIQSIHLLAQSIREMVERKYERHEETLTNILKQRQAAVDDHLSGRKLLQSGEVSKGNCGRGMCSNSSGLMVLISFDPDFGRSSKSTRSTSRGCTASSPPTGRRTRR